MLFFLITEPGNAGKKKKAYVEKMLSVSPIRSAVFVLFLSPEFCLWLFWLVEAYPHNLMKPQQIPNATTTLQLGRAQGSWPWVAADVPTWCKARGVSRLLFSLLLTSTAQPAWESDLSVALSSAMQDFSFSNQWLSTSFQGWSIQQSTFFFLIIILKDEKLWNLTWAKKECCWVCRKYPKWHQTMAGFCSELFTSL